MSFAGAFVDPTAERTLLSYSDASGFCFTFGLSGASSVEVSTCVCGGLLERFDDSVSIGAEYSALY